MYLVMDYTKQQEQYNDNNEVAEELELSEEDY